MAAYTTLIILKQKYDRGLLSDLTDENDTGDIVDEKITRAITEANAEIDGYLKGRYPDDIETVNIPNNINRIANMLVIYYLYSNQSAIELPSFRRKDYEEAIKSLEKIQKMEISPFDEADEPTVFRKNTRTRFFGGNTTPGSTVKASYWDGYN
jgi:phage gp36-like protein